MTIKEIQGLLLNDFEVFKNTLLTNQEDILSRFEEEHVFISALSLENLQKKLDNIKGLSLEGHPLLGVPFVVKDNIDVDGFNTTAGCLAYSYTPKESAFAVKQLEQAGAICIGKGNMDQFATGLVGIRSPYGTATNSFNKDYIPGGSSSGSASAVASGYAPFSLGTDTAGSGRVPAAFQNLIGLKPTKGTVSNVGVVPACKSQDCITIFANVLEDAAKVLRLMAVYDINDPYSRKYYNGSEIVPLKTIAVPREDNLSFFGNHSYERAYSNFIEGLKQKGYEVKTIDFSPMLNAAKLLYDGPWVAERYHAVGAFIEKNLEHVDKTVGSIILNGKNPSAIDYFEAEYNLARFKKEFEKYAALYKSFIMPTTGTIYTKTEVQENPVALNSNLGYYTNFMNLLDCSAIALPVSIEEGNLPFGITLFSVAFQDEHLLNLANTLCQDKLLNLSDNSVDYIDLAVCGAHKKGGALNYQLTEIGAVFKTTSFTLSEYRFFALEHMEPPRPGLIRDPDNGGKIEVEIWKVPSTKLGGFIHQVGAPLSFGKVLLENGESVTSFLSESYALSDAVEITRLQSWENYLIQKERNKS
ncbi:allophanate hydrolase [Ulvibacterium sp.]|uniref:allophanate hydrolase n=1 Tax=Ulvibacterium sp. TaxID=2665914 RepID=UPI0026024CD8|nr:allophanate hydrolase [Ulvibacterium sp.]